MTSYEWHQGNSAGPHQAPVTKFVVHTTEGSSIEGAIAAYEANNSWPHRTLDSKSKRNCGHLGLDVAARSLKNLSGGVETNTAGVIQIEVVGFAEHPEDINWEWVGAEIGPMCREAGIPIQSSVVWVAYPDSYGKNAAQRLSPQAWLDYRGVLGHQHAPENDHGDPGAIPIELVLDAASPPPPPERPRKTMDLSTNPGDGFVHGVVIGPKPNQNVYHYYAENADALFDAPSENLGGFAKDVTCTWSGDDFVVWCHGKNDHIWMRVWKPGVGWSPNWVEAPEGTLAG